MPETTKKDFETFKKEVEKWIKRFGLFGWDVSFRHEEGVIDSLGSCSVQVVERSAIISFSVDWDGDVISTQRIKATAFHEVCELLLFPFSIMAQDRYTTEVQLLTEKHNIISILESAVFDS